MSYLIVWSTGQPASELLEQSVGAESSSLTLRDLKADTEYVINLYPLFPRDSASPATLTARTCESLKKKKTLIKAQYNIMLKHYAPFAQLQYICYQYMHYIYAITLSVYVWVCSTFRGCPAALR